MSSGFASIDSSKTSLINFLLQVKSKALAQKSLVIATSHKYITQIIQEADSVLKNLQNFIVQCESLIKNIIDTKFIQKKDFYTPIENALLSYNIDNFLSKISSPSLTISKISKISPIFEYFPTFFLFSFYNYSDLAIEYLEKHKITVFPSKNDWENEKFEWNSRCLPLAGRKIFITGGEESSPINKSYVINIETQEITIMPNIKKNRCWHAMTWIEGRPAVIAGYDGHKCIDFVEIYENNQWIMHSSIVEPRKWLSAICFKGIPWIVGGFNYNRLDSIEKYENKRWTLIDLRLERPLTSVGLACNEAGILILGGKIDEDRNSSDVYLFDTKNYWIKKIFELKSSVFFTQNLCYTKNEKIFICGQDDQDRLGKFSLN